VTIDSLGYRAAEALRQSLADITIPEAPPLRRPILPIVSIVVASLILVGGAAIWLVQSTGDGGAVRVASHPSSMPAPATPITTTPTRPRIDLNSYLSVYDSLATGPNWHLFLAVSSAGARKNTHVVCLANTSPGESESCVELISDGEPIPMSVGLGAPAAHDKGSQGRVRPPWGMVDKSVAAMRAVFADGTTAAVPIIDSRASAPTNFFVVEEEASSSQPPVAVIALDGAGRQVASSPPRG